MTKKMKLRTKLLVSGIILTTVPLLLVCVAIYDQYQTTLHTTTAESMRLAFADLDHMAEMTYNLVASHQAVNEIRVKDSLNLARELAASNRGISQSAETVKWEATNQFTKASSQVELPKMLLGASWFGQIKDPAVSVPVVDQVKALMGVTCTIFQRMNAAGDMLRIATNVVNKDGTRAVGTYIPALNADGKPNPVIASVSKGEVFTGRAFVVDSWYMAAYEPIYDGNKTIIGMLYVGVPQEAAKTLRKAIMDLKVGTTGYIFVLDSQGQYVISKDGKRDGEKLWEAKDSTGNLFIQEIIKKAHQIRPGEIAEHRYPWKNQEDPAARMKIARIVYYGPWDWVIGVSSYLDEFEEATNKLASAGRRGFFILLSTFAASLVLALFVWLFIANGIARPLNRVIEGMSETAQQVTCAAGEVSSSSETLAGGASQQAASIEEISSSLEEMSSMTKLNADHARQADLLMKDANTLIEKSERCMAGLTTSMEHISRSSEETSKIVKTIDGIAFQTNLLALNAAVEAARAGEAGAGFAVVADEVRTLAMRTAEAARNTSDLIEGTVKRIREGTEQVGLTNKVSSEVARSAATVGGLVAEIATASGEQALGIEEINKAVAEMDKVVQHNAANAEESASGAEEMNAQADQLQTMTSELIALVGGKGNSG